MQRRNLVNADEAWIHEKTPGYASEPDLGHLRHRTECFWHQGVPFPKLLQKSIHDFLAYLAERQTYTQTNPNDYHYITTCIQHGDKEN